jgi:hypothetical protein
MLAGPEGAKSECGVVHCGRNGGMVGAMEPSLAPVSEATGIGLVRGLASDILEAGNSFLVAYNQHISGGTLVARREMGSLNKGETRRNDRWSVFEWP